jgi:nucleotide-binding universal stress UspA family protein
MSTVLVAVDFSDVTQLVVERAAELARALSARIVLLHVVEPEATHLPLRGEDVSAVAWPLRISRGLKARLSALAVPLKADRLEVKPVAHIGLVVEGILEHAVGYHTELIILGCHGHLAAQHVLSGNVLIQILRHAPCPVVVIPIESATSKSDIGSNFETDARPSIAPALVSR